LLVGYHNVFVVWLDGFGRPVEHCERSVGECVALHAEMRLGVRGELGA